MRDLEDLRRQLAYPDDHLHPLDPAAVVRVARRAQARRRGGVAALVLVSSAVLGLAVLAGSRGSEPTLLDPAPVPSASAPADPAQEMTPSTGYLTSAQAARAGVDGRSVCETRDPAVQAGAQVTGAPQLVAGYLTDSAGLREWDREFGGRVVADPLPLPAAHAICWYLGAFDIDSQAEADGRLEAPHVLLLFPLEADAYGASSLVSRFPIAVLAPPAPDRALLPAELRDAGTYVAPQPGGVQLLDGDTPPTPHPRPSPAPDAIVGDCVPYGCPDANEVPVRVDVTVDGRPVTATDVVPVRVGQTLELVVTITAPQQATVTDLSVGVSGEGSRLDEVLARAADQGPGAREYRLSWAVTGPADQPRNLRLEYTAASPLHGDQALTINRPLVQLDVS